MEENEGWTEMAKDGADTEVEEEVEEGGEKGRHTDDPEEFVDFDDSVPSVDSYGFTQEEYERAFRIFSAMKRGEDYVDYSFYFVMLLPLLAIVGGTAISFTCLYLSQLLIHVQVETEDIYVRMGKDLLMILAYAAAMWIPRMIHKTLMYHFTELFVTERLQSPPRVIDIFPEGIQKVLPAIQEHASHVKKAMASPFCDMLSKDMVIPSFYPHPSPFSETHRSAGISRGIISMTLRDLESSTLVSKDERTSPIEIKNRMSTWVSPLRVSPQNSFLSLHTRIGIDLAGYPLTNLLKFSRMSAVVGAISSGLFIILCIWVSHSLYPFTWHAVSPPPLSPSDYGLSDPRPLVIADLFDVYREPPKNVDFCLPLYSPYGKIVAKIPAAKFAKMTLYEVDGSHNLPLLPQFMEVVPNTVSRALAMDTSPILDSILCSRMDIRRSMDTYSPIIDGWRIISPRGTYYQLAVSLDPFPMKVTPALAAALAILPMEDGAYESEVLLHDEGNHEIGVACRRTTLGEDGTVRSMMTLNHGRECNSSESTYMFVATANVVTNTISFAVKSPVSSKVRIP